ncbi:hypothetical protein E2C01_090634 [Portunus trituberculatus]|uniref:Uncharacterized protein n=1 Tax=Portunus trituberculatus TaxID=210409 RepID=A0A5B7JLW8_PORTR|nr:hypothetical protein [Portunus trituberculatus]
MFGQSAIFCEGGRVSRKPELWRAPRTAAEDSTAGRSFLTLTGGGAGRECEEGQ